jgi:hypothetical protein
MPIKELDEAGLVAMVDYITESARAFGLDGTVFILKMARLDMVARFNGITVDELKAFCAALENRMEPAAPARSASNTAKHKRARRARRTRTRMTRRS